MMSDLCDNQKVWATQFSGCGLLSAPEEEENVRVKLDKHRHKAALLREELEKELLYVQHLEHKLCELDSIKDPHQPQDHQQDGVPSGGNNKEEEEAVPLTADQSQKGCPTQFITVIEVNGHRALKKVPPKPPPKRVSSRPVSIPVPSPEVCTAPPAEELPPVPPAEDHPQTPTLPLSADGSVERIPPDGESEDDPEDTTTEDTTTTTDTTEMTDPGGSGDDNPLYSDYVNIDYFIRKKNLEDTAVSPVLKTCKPRLSRSKVVGTIDSDDEDEDYDGLVKPRRMLLHSLISTDSGDRTSSQSASAWTSTDADDVDSDNCGRSSLSSLEIEQLNHPAKSWPTAAKFTQTEDANAAKEEAERIAMYKCIIASILDSETIYVDCLSILFQYKKALCATVNTSQPLVTQDEINTIFYKIPELHDIHRAFLEGMRKRMQNWDGKLTVGDHFKILASQITVYAAFLKNYSKAIETVRRCSAENAKFAELTKIMKPKSLKGQSISLEDLLHKPVARLQENALVLHDLLKFTPVSHPDHNTLRVALRMTKSFLKDFNNAATESMFPFQDRAQRHLVKNSFVVELSEGHRKLRHLFLFNDVIVCAKYKALAKGKFTFEVKWFIPLADVVLPEPDEVKELKEASPQNVLLLRSQATMVRDQILLERNLKSSGRNVDRLRKKLADLEAQLLLASPNLVFHVGHRVSRVNTFYLSSEFDREQWTEALKTLQKNASSTLSINFDELQAWIAASRKLLKTNMGSYLLRSVKDEDLLVGDLHVVVHTVQGLPRATSLFLCLELDSYGHFFRRAKSKTSEPSTDPVWDQDFNLELEGAQTLRILCYEENASQAATLRGKAFLELHQSWLTMQLQVKTLSLQDYTLVMSIQFTPKQVKNRRESIKPCGQFGVKVGQICKKENRMVPFLIEKCIQEVEKRGMQEVGIYRVSGSASDVQKLKKTFESNAYEAEQLLKEVDIHSVSGLLRLYLRELPEGLFTDARYKDFLETFGGPNSDAKTKKLLQLFNDLPDPNKGILLYLLEHMARINKLESQNKMSLQNLATVFGPTLLRLGTKSDSSNSGDLLAAGTIDVMNQAGMLYFYLKRVAQGETLTYASDHG